MQLVGRDAPQRRLRAPRWRGKFVGRRPVAPLESLSSGHWLPEHFVSFLLVVWSSRTLTPPITSRTFASSSLCPTALHREFCSPYASSRRGPVVFCLGSAVAMFVDLLDYFRTIDAFGHLNGFRMHYSKTAPFLDRLLSALCASIHRFARVYHATVRWLADRR